MPFETINIYLEKLEARRIETKLMFADVISLPNMKNKDREGLVMSWMRTMDIQSPKETRTASPARLKMMGIGVRYVK
jgi:hypothetical protein